MNGEDLKFLAHRAESVRGRSDHRLEEVHAGIRSARRRRVAGAVAATTAAVLAAVVGIAALAGPSSVDKNDGPPPANSGTPTPTTKPTTTRPVVYSDVTWRGPGGLSGDPIHVGDRAVESGSGFVHMAVVDDGVVYATGGYQDDGRLWFADGGTPVQIASRACPSERGWPGWIITGNSGPLVAWFDCAPNPDRRGDLVVYDTSSGREVGRVEDPERGCSFDTQLMELLSDQCTAIIGDHVYVKNRVYIARGGALISASDKATGSAFLHGIRNNPRGLVVGNSWATGVPTTGGVFSTVGTRLVPIRDGRLTTAFDTATRRQVQLHLPPGYRPGDGANYGLFEWLDDDTVALEGYSSGPHDQDILTCRLATGRCELTVPSLGRDRAYRVVQNENLGDVQFDVSR